MQHVLKGIAMQKCLYSQKCLFTRRMSQESVQILAINSTNALDQWFSTCMNSRRTNPMHKIK